tara:strand:- start:2207 stop:3133 length:927 start_codon:yes stop_codon:yes gene_type:complete
MLNTLGLQALYTLSVKQVQNLLDSLLRQGLKREISLTLDSLERSGFDLDYSIYREKLSKLTVVSVHQSGFLPWPGYFHKVMYADCFVWLDHVDIARKNFVSRVPIKSFSGKKYLNLPLRKHSHMDKIYSIQLADEDWKTKHIGQLSYYSKAPFFDEIMDKVKQWYASAYGNRLNQVNWFLFQMVLDLLNISPEIMSSKDMNLTSKKEELMIEITKKIGGNVYLSGTQAATYQSVDTFAAQEISLVYQRFYDYQQKFPYNQGNSEFSNGVSILDLLFYYGPEGAKKYIKQYDEYSLRLQIDNLLNPKHL